MKNNSISHYPPGGTYHIVYTLISSKCLKQDWHEIDEDVLLSLNIAQPMVVKFATDQILIVRLVFSLLSVVFSGFK